MTAPYGWTIAVICRDSSHAPKEVKVTSFAWVNVSRERPDLFGDVGDFAMWEHDLDAQQDAWDGDPYDGPGRQLPAERHQVAETLTHDGRFWEGDDGDAPQRYRYSMRCRLCGLHVAVRGERLYPVLDRLADHGIASVGLADIGAIVA